MKKMPFIKIFCLTLKRTDNFKTTTLEASKDNSERAFQLSRKMSEKCHTESKKHCDYSSNAHQVTKSIAIRVINIIVSLSIIIIIVNLFSR